MNAIVTQPPAPRAHIQVYDPVAVLDTAKFEHFMRIAKVMACSSLIPDSLTIKDKQKLDFDAVLGNCFLVVNQAARWNADPFAVAQCVSVVRGKICYEGKLIAAIIAAKLGVRLRFDWNDETGDAFGIVVSGVIPSESEPRAINGTVGQWKTDNEQWRKNPRNMLAYRGSREWGRLHAADIMLGVYSPDELEDLTDNMKATRAKDVTRKEPPAIPQDEPAKIARAGANIHGLGPDTDGAPNQDYKPEPESFQDELAKLEKTHAAEDAEKRAAGVMEKKRQTAAAKPPEEFAEEMDAKERAIAFAKMRAEETARVDAVIAEQKRKAEKAKREEERREAEEEAALAAVEAQQRAIAAEENFTNLAQEQAIAAKRAPPNPDEGGLLLTDELMAKYQAEAAAREAPNPALKALIEEGTAHAKNGRKAVDGLDRWYNGLCVKDLDLINPVMRQLIAVAKKADGGAV
jgi:hypothetical protein